MHTILYSLHFKDNVTKNININEPKYNQFGFAIIVNKIHCSYIRHSFGRNAVPLLPMKYIYINVAFALKLFRPESTLCKAAK